MIDQKRRDNGSFSDAHSVSISYDRGSLYLVAANERHSWVNRSSDLTGMYANPPAAYFAADTADEDADKVAAQYTFATGTACRSDGSEYGSDQKFTPIQPLEDLGPDLPSGLASATEV